MAKVWHIIHSKPNNEDFLFSLLYNRGIETIYPQLRVKSTSARTWKIKPDFTDYLFGNVYLNTTPHSNLANIPGPNNVISFDNEPATFPEQVFTILKERFENLTNLIKMKSLLCNQVILC